jgi:hypothetical protein
MPFHPPQTAQLASPMLHKGLTRGCRAAEYNTCLSSQAGAICCALGDCTGQPACPPTLKSWSNTAKLGATLQLVSRNLTQDGCE